MTARFSISQQIEEVDRELELRDRVYKGKVHSGAWRASVAEFHMERMRSVKATLEWLRANETDVRAYVAAKAAKPKDAAA